MLTLQFRLAAHQGRERTHILDVPFGVIGADAVAEFAGAHWRLELDWRDVSEGRRAGRFAATVTSGKAEAVAAGLV